MSKRMLTLKRTMVLLSMGGATFAFFAFPGASPGCVTNTDLVNFYQGVGGASVEAFRDSTANIIGSDFDDIVLTPTAGFVTELWNNWVAQQFPLDPVPGEVLKQ